MVLKLNYIDILAHAFFFDEHNRKLLPYSVIREYGENTIKLLKSWYLIIETNVSEETTKQLLDEEICCFKVEDEGISIRPHVTKEILEKRYIQNTSDVISVAFRNEKNIMKLNEVQKCK